MSTEGPTEDIERAPEIIGDVLEIELFHETELSQLQQLLDDIQDISDEDWDEKFNDAGDDLMLDIDNGPWSTDEETDDPEPCDEEDEWTAHRPLSVKDISFEGKEEVRVPQETTTPFEFFKLLFTTEFLNGIVSSTNTFASLIMAQGQFAENLVQAWKELTIEELLTFLGIFFQMGTVRAAQYQDYWSGHYLHLLFARKYMRRNRFMLILRFLRFGQNNVESLLEYFNNKMFEIYSPGENLAVEESFILPGRCRRYGFKLYVLETPGGVTLQTHLDTPDDEVDEDEEGIPHRDKMVVKLLDKYLRTGRHVYMDRFFVRVELAKFLLENKTNVTGTLFSCRANNPKVVCANKLKRGDCIYRFSKEGICVCKWHRTHDILSISTKFSPDLKPYITRKGRTILKPEMVIEYDKIMDSVERHEEIFEYYTLENDSMRWYKKVGIHVLQIMMMNAYFLYNMKNDVGIKLYDFRESVITTLLPPPPPTRSSANGQARSNSVPGPARLPKYVVRRSKRKRH